MQILNEKVINSESFKLLQSMIKNRYIKDNSTESIVSYNEFREGIKTFIEKIMNSFLENTKFCNDKYSCVIKVLPSYRRGQFNPENNIITINEAVIEDIYLGKINSMTTIFHELNHFKIKYDTELGGVNKDIIRTIKEHLLRSTSQDPFDEKKCFFKKDCFYISDDYYKCNYRLFSDEKIAEINAINNLILFIEIIGIKISEQHLKQLKEKIEKNTNQYNNYLRDMRLNFHFNDFFLDFEEAFDVMIKYNPKWLEIPQLNIEYYIAENGTVSKRTREELEERLKIETDVDIKKYIQYLLTPNSSKNLCRSEFPPDNTTLKEDRLNFYPINSRKSSFKR